MLEPDSRGYRELALESDEAALEVSCHFMRILPQCDHSLQT